MFIIFINIRVVQDNNLIAAVSREHFAEALKESRRSVSDEDIRRYESYAEKLHRSGPG